MKVSELIELLEDQDPDAEVLLMTQENWPFENAIEGVAVREEMLKSYPAKTRKKRQKQILANDPESPPEIGANTRTVPGIISQRGCT